MEEPKHRRRAQTVQPEQTEPEKAELNEQQTVAHRRRRQAMAEPEQHIELHQMAEPGHKTASGPIVHSEPHIRRERPAQDASRIRAERQTESVHHAEKRAHAHSSRHEHGAQADKGRKKNKTDYRQQIDRAVMGVAALLGMAGAAVWGAAKHIKPALAKLDQQYIQRIRKKYAGKNANTQEYLRLAAMVVCVCMALFSAWQVGSIVLRSVRTSRLNDSLSQQRAAIIDAQQAQPDEDQEAAQAIVMFTPEPAPVSVESTAAPVEAPVQTQQPVQPEATRVPDVVKTTKYRRVGGDALPEMAAMYEKNRDLVAWIQIPDVLDLPVVYRDNSYYLTRDFNKQKNTSGTIFLDVNHPFKEKTQNLLLHGHNMKDGTMFGRLAQYLYDDTYLRNHPFINFDTLWHKEQYVIFAVLNVSLKPGEERFFNYFTHNTFASDVEFSMYIRQLQLRSHYAIPIDVEPSDALVTLSTCLDDDRLVIVARRLRENETRSDLRALIRMATKQ
ncbi:MAG: sortase [Clostridia bacterium]|nr:sortase [Clostridia bacterium]